MADKNQRSVWTPFWISALCSSSFVAISSRFLPPLVASHFDSAGHVNGRMPHATYAALTLVIVIVAPLFVTALPIRAFRKSAANINLPHREYWLAAERRTDTIDTLSRYAIRFGIVLQLFLCYFHLVVVEANIGSAPSLVSDAFTAGIVLLLITVLLWVVALFMRFQRTS